MSIAVDSLYMYPQDISHELQKKILSLTRALWRVTDLFSPKEALRRLLREKATEIFAAITEYKYRDKSSAGAGRIAGGIEVIKGYLHIAESLRIVRRVNFDVLIREYDALLLFFKKEFINGEYPHGELSPWIREGKKAESADVRETLWDNKISAPFSSSREESYHDTSDIPETKQGENKKGEIKNVSKKDEGETEKESVSSHNPGMLNERQKKIIECIGRNARAKISDLYPFFDDVSSKTLQRDLQDLVNRNLIKKEGEKRWTMYVNK
ncbi:MAG: hypothetical protein G01um101433_463 [Parcubacteria group bacterium Gr01-1014_33]|nr:MAG: hypothetical protein G01um101433_463 [Parcubacteria group bacterium Gr01-1014_33]